jgi:hypothetical protein
MSVTCDSCKRVKEDVQEVGTHWICADCRVGGLRNDNLSASEPSQREEKTS